MRATGFSLHGLIALVALAPGLLVAAQVQADRFNSSSYTIDASVGNSFGGPSASGGYKMTSSGGEAVVGNGTAGSYKLGTGYSAQLEKSIQLSVQPAEVQLHYPMDEPVGTRLFDDTDGGMNGALVNSPARITGKIGRAVDFDGSTQYATAGGMRSLDVDAGEVRTVSAWFKAGVQPARAYIVNQSANCQGWSLSLLTSGNVQFDYSASDNGCTTPSSYSATSTLMDYDDDAWHHVVGVVDRPGAAIRLYVDGELKASASGVNNTKASADGNLVIGAKSDLTAHFDGLIDEVKVFASAFGNKAAAREYTAQNNGISSSLAFPDIVPNQSGNVAAKMVVRTDAPGYTLALSQDQNLTSGVNSISPIAGSIETPALWSEGTTKGLGFTLTTAPNLDGKWGSNPAYKYAPVPGSQTSFFTRSGYTGGIIDVLTSQYRLDVNLTQPTGDYKNTVTYTATVLP